MEELAILIPTLNEAASIGTVIDRVPAEDLMSQGYKTSVYVIDGLSTDNTTEIAAEKGARIIAETRKGKGIALQTALRSVKADYFVIVDGDNTYPLEVTPQMVHLLQTHDVVIGSRLTGTIEPGAMTRLNFFGNKALTLLARVLFDVSISDVCTGLWAYRGDALQRLLFKANGFDIEANMCVECARSGLRMAEIPITYSPRVGVAKLASVRDGLQIGAYMIRRSYQHGSNGTAVHPDEDGHDQAVTR